MPRPLRLIAPGLVYHVVNRGNNRQNVFFKTGDYEAFLKALLDLQQRKPFALYGDEQPFPSADPATAT